MQPWRVYDATMRKFPSIALIVHHDTNFSLDHNQRARRYGSAKPTIVHYIGSMVPSSVCVCVCVCVGGGGGGGDSTPNSLASTPNLLTVVYITTEKALPEC